MKKLIAILALVALTVTVNAQVFRSQTLLGPGVGSVAVSNTIPVTNLSTLTFYGLTATNPTVGVIWTNLSGISNNVVGAGDANNLLGTAVLWADRNGNWPSLGQSNYYASFGFRLVGQSGANSAVTFTFVPVYDGTNEATAAGDVYTVAVTATGASMVVTNTPVPLYKWPGCKSIRLRGIVNADTDASSQVNVQAVQLNGFIP